MTKRLALVLFIAAGLASSSPRPMHAQAPEQPPFKGGVEAVTIDVGVVDSQGRPVGDLGSGDFIVTVAGRPRRVVSATYLGPEASTGIATEALAAPGAPAGRRPLLDLHRGSGRAPGAE